ncbi:MAG: hypothetical protein CMH54_03105 [Myxococcales bacterium]|nr:hypothetical protein [Myxococcales bacterium]
MSTMKLYQFELCPYCHKVKAGLDLKGIPYEKIEVNPMNKKELAHFGPTPDGKKKVPVVEYGDKVLRESTDILRWLDEVKPEGHTLLSDDTREQAEEINTWVDNDLTQILPTVLYGSWGQSIKAARLTAKTSNFSRFDNIKISLFGSVIMKMIAKRILKRRGNGQTGEQLLSTELDKLETWLGDKPYLCGDDVTLADASTHGALSCVKEFPAFRFIEERPQIKAWYDRVSELRSQA